MTTLHEALLHLLRSDPSLLPSLIGAFRPDLPLSGWREVSEALGEPRPLRRHADLVLQHPECPILLILEVQRQIDRTKRRAWPYYAAAASSRHDQDALLVVITLDRAVAAWAEEPIVSPCGIFQPFVLGPDQIPSHIDSPAALTLAALARGDREPALIRRTVLALAKVDKDTAAAYFNLIYTRWHDLAVTVLEEIMNTQPYDSTAFDRFMADYSYRRGKQEGKAEGLHEAHRRLATKLLQTLGRTQDIPRLDTLDDEALPAFVDDLLHELRQR